MPPEWIEGLKNEAISNYITFFAGVILTAFGWLIVRFFTRRKPSIIRVDKIFETSLIDIHSRINDKIKITYEDKPIEGFHEAEFKIYNTGEVPIEDVELIFAIEELEKNEFIEVVFTNTERIEAFTVLNPENEKPTGPVDFNEYDPVEYDPDAFRLYLPFLNPLKVYEDYLGVTMYAPNPIVVKGVVGKGLGWTTRYSDKTVYTDKMIDIAGRTTGYITGSLLRIVFRFL